MGILELSLEELRTRISAGEELTLADNFLFNGNILIGKERVLTEKELDRMDGKVIDKLKVAPHRERLTDPSTINSFTALCIKFLKEAPCYSGLHSEIRSRIEQTFRNQLPYHDYVCLRATQIKKAAPSVLKRSILTAINALIIDIHQQKLRNPDGMQNSLRFEAIMVAGLLREIGFMKTGKATLSKSIGELRNAQDPLYLQVPRLTEKILRTDQSKSALSDEHIQTCVQSWERLDGSGGPEGLKGTEIRPEALAVALGAELHLYLSGELAKTKRSWTEIKRRFRSLKSQFGEELCCRILPVAFKHLERTMD